MISLCPYCRSFNVNSRDHIFSQFLGGSQTIPACRKCNSTFGNDFEARVSRQMIPLLFLLGNSGVPLHKSVIWKNAVTHLPTGLAYDLKREENGSIRGVLSKTTRIENESGELIGLRVPDSLSVNRKLKELKAKGITEVQVQVKESIVKQNIPMFKFGQMINDDFRRLILKMCVAFSRKMKIDTEIIEDKTLFTMLNVHHQFQHGVKNLFFHHHIFDSIAPPLAHLIYVEACSMKNHAYAIVRLFGSVQFYTILNQRYRGADFSGIGILNPLDSSEVFTESDKFNIPEPKQYCLNIPHGYLVRTMFRQLDKQIEKAFGYNSYKFSPTEAQMLYLSV